MEPVQARASLREWLVTGLTPRPRNEAEAFILATAAGEQGVSGLLHADVVARPDSWPPSVIDALRAAHHHALVRGVRQLDAAARVQSLLRDRGLRSLPLKGAALVERLYDGVADRPMADVDILALDDWPASVRTLREAGFDEREAADHARAFEDPVSGTMVELHHSVTSCPGLFPVDVDGLWTRSAAAAGQIARVPSEEDLLVQLALHAAFQHGLVLTLVQFLDFRRLFERMPPDAAGILASAERAGALGAVAAALEAASAVVGLRVPEEVSRVLLPHRNHGLRGRINDARRDPLRLITPTAPALAPIRWALAEGRRLAFVAGTLAPREPGTPLRLHRALFRAGMLAWRWGPQMNRA